MTSPAFVELSLDFYTPKGSECGCSSCGRLFASERAFDLHRAGDYGVGRKCADNPEWTGLELNARGLWRRRATNRR